MANISCQRLRSPRAMDKSDVATGGRDDAGDRNTLGGNAVGIDVIRPWRTRHSRRLWRS